MIIATVKETKIEVTCRNKDAQIMTINGPILMELPADCLFTVGVKITISPYIINHGNLSITSDDNFLSEKFLNVSFESPSFHSTLIERFKFNTLQDVKIKDINMGRMPEKMPHLKLNLHFLMPYISTAFVVLACIAVSVVCYCYCKNLRNN